MAFPSTAISRADDNRDYHVSGGNDGVDCCDDDTLKINRITTAVVKEEQPSSTPIDG